MTVYAITSLTALQADPVLLARWLRGHWAIEALHWIRDVSFDEDRSQVRSSHGPQIMAALRNLVVTALRLAGVTNIAAAATPPRPRPAPPACHLQDHVTSLPQP